MELQWIGVAFSFGLLAKLVGQPPLLGYLAAGFALEFLGLRPDPSLESLASVGISLLLFGVGLKLDVRSVVRPQVWAVAVSHMALTVALASAVAFGLAALGVGLFASLTLEQAALIGFALSFSSTVFAVKVLEQRDDVGALYGRLAIGILVVQDLAAVLFLAVSHGKVPSVWALLLPLLLAVRPLLLRALSWVGHGELLALAGLAATLGGAALFESVGIKGDLGALLAGVLLGGHDKSNELSKTLLGLKDVFLVGFFLSVGLTGLPTVETTVIAVGLLVLLPFKSLLFASLLLRARLRARTAFFGTSILSNYSEFGLIVGALAVAKGWLPAPWLIVFALATAFSFLASSPVNTNVYELYRRLRESLLRRESPTRIPEEQPVDARDARALVFGVGRVGSSAYDELRQRFGEQVIGFDVDVDAVADNQAEGRRVLRASATDPDFWERLHIEPARVEVVVLAMASHAENLNALRQLRQSGFDGFLAATARYTDEVEHLESEGASAAFQVLAEAGAGLVRHVFDRMDAASLDAAPHATTDSATL